MKPKLFAGNQPLRFHSVPVRGEAVKLEGEDFYRIANYDQMRPFFMSIVSDADHWMFISSTGALTAGRRNPDGALFPYYTDDKIHDSAEITGSKTLLIVRRQGRDLLWQPFSALDHGRYRIRRSLFKNFLGNKIIFEEINDDLALTFRYGWFNSERFGLIRPAWLINSGSTANVSLLDGIQNLMPAGIGSQFQLEKSTLLDAYKKSELLPDTGLGLFLLSSVPIDRPEPAESLKATTAFCLGLKPRATLLSSRQLEHFCRSAALRTETDIRAERGAYFVQADLRLNRNQIVEWLIAADVERGPSQVAELNQLLRWPARLRQLVLADVERGSCELRRLVASADGLQTTAQPIAAARHFGNVLFNIMRGGIFDRGYAVDTADLRQFIRHANPSVAARHAPFFRRLKVQAKYSEIVTAATATNDAQLERLCREYLPLTFSRRHGDPSRPWNRFSITARNPDGSRILNYEGNWRDIFQNWEALALSFPGYTAGMICRFVNASTADGYNPYRVTRDGIDWEVSDPHDPWSFIGYWGDHQIIYLLKLLEVLESHEPATLRAFLTRPIFAYANVPYRIKPYDSLLKDPKDTVTFDSALEKTVQERVRACGSDGKLVWDAHGNVRLVNLTEKLLVPLLAKLSNFIPEAGIWLNTQRPEWNDANNALVGNGVSMVTLYYLRRHLAFLRELFPSESATKFSVSSEVTKLFASVHEALEQHRPLLAQKINDRDRKRVLDTLGRAGETYRQRSYERGFSGRTRPLTSQSLNKFLGLALEWVDHSIRANRRRDGLYHAYNLVSFTHPRELPIRRLYEMLEGQVAVLSSGLLSANESLRVLTALRKSAMYRADQHSYVLYPDRRLPRFIEKNNLPAGSLAKSALLRKLVADGNTLLVERDVTGRLHFNGSIRNAGDVRQKLDQLATAGYERLVRKESDSILRIFEDLFDHQSFTGRSGTFFGYEGLGSIYWHMVSKLLLAAQETFFRVTAANAPAEVLRQLAACYHDIRAGIGDRKTPENYGAFPMDPYSHTPAHAGARQPGLTGQVKEDILCRWGELGVSVKAGQIQFCPLLLQRSDFLKSPADFRYFDLSGTERHLRLPANSLAFSYCQTPIIYQLGNASSLSVNWADGSKQTRAVLHLDPETSRSIFAREGRIRSIVVAIDPADCIG